MIGRIAAIALLLILLPLSSGCVTTSLLFAGIGTGEDPYMTWKDCMNDISEPSPASWVQLLGGFLYLIVETPFILFDTTAFLVYLWVEGNMKIVVPDYDMRHAKSWLCWWAVLLGDRQFTFLGPGKRKRRG